MLSEEMQLSPQSGGFPLNKNALDQKLEESRQMIEQGEVSVSGGLPSAETIDEMIQELRNILEGLITAAPGDMKVFTIVREEFASFMSGQKSAEEVGKLIHNRVETYLNE